MKTIKFHCNNGIQCVRYFTKLKQESMIVDLLTSSKLRIFLSFPFNPFYMFLNIIITEFCIEIKHKLILSNMYVQFGVTFFEMQNAYNK